jgi:predicted permease
MGRSIVATDELPGAEPVVLIGYDVWQSNFAADPRVVGRTLRLDDVTHTVIGVMPPEFAFPINDRYWTPLRTDTVGDVLVFARLRPEIDIASAGAELAALGFTSEHAAAEGPLLPVTHVVPYTRAFSTGEPLEDVLLTFGVWLLGLVLVPPCANIAILVYARTISRQHEFTTRVALGASRSRIVGQLFIETLVLASMSALAALVMLRLGFSMRFFSSTNDPFWIEYDLLSPQIVLFAAGLAVFAALIAGGIPAIQATRRTSEAARVLSGTDGLHLGWSWTGMVVAQIAFSLMILPTAIEAAWGLMQPSIIDPGFIPEDYLIASVAMSDDGADDGRLARQVAAFRNRIGAEPGVVGMALSSNPPGLEAPNAVVLEVEGVGASRATGETETHQVQVNPIDPAFMELFPMTLQAGRVPAAAPDGVEVREVLVNGNFIASTGAGLGSRLRHLWGPQSAPDLWFDIVGIVDDVPRNTGSARLYHMGTPAPVGTRTLSIRTLANPGAFANQLRDIASTVDPRLRVSDVRRLDLAYSDGPVGFSLILAQIVAGTTASLLLLGAAGLYALMSFTIARKRREIGIRAALGAQSGKLLAGIFRNTLMRVLAGALVGLVLALAIERLLSPILHGIDLDGGIGIRDIPGIVPAAALVMILVGIGAAVGPSRRGPAIWTDASFRRRFPSCSRRETDNASSLS